MQETGILTGSCLSLRYLIFSYFYLQFKNNFSDEVDWYKKEARQNSYDLPDKLRQRYSFDPIAKVYTMEQTARFTEDIDVSENKTGLIAGFWIRRAIDGSDKAIYSVMEKIMTQYDNNFWETLKQYYNY